MKALIAKSKLSQVAVGIFIVFVVIMMAKSGYHFGAWLHGVTQ